MFLKRIEIQGFKSFADKVVIQFEHSITGIVGPNGCGKSNITDAIRWVLGEQSVKSLRGNNMIDVIFAGSADRKMVNVAEVTLVFDNTRRFLNSQLDEIEVTRRLYRNGQDAEYLINRSTCRLKDIVDLIMDSGLGKDSLSMISQGNISSFAEAKPIDRRAIFEEAAGVSKYKKRKLESLSKLERTQDNIERSQDILLELEKQVSPLKKQAKKAVIYREKMDRLQQIEIAVLVDDISQLSKQLEDSRKVCLDLESQLLMQETTLQVNETQTNENKKVANDLDRDINKIQEEYLKVFNDIQLLEASRIKLEEKRKYAIEVGNQEEKEKEIKQLYNEAILEYDDRLARFKQTEVDISLFTSSLNNINHELIELTSKKEMMSNQLRHLQNRFDQLSTMLKDPFTSQHGVKSIMDNEASLLGIMGVVGVVLKPSEGYEEAISVALGGSLYNIVTNNEEAARKAIHFLKKNQSGKATFLPLTVLKPRYLNREHEIIANNVEGYLGIAKDFISCESVFNSVAESLLGQVLVCSDLQVGNTLATYLNYNYKIVTLDGEVIHRGGSMTGGKVRNETSIITFKKQLTEVKNSLDSKQAELALIQKSIDEKGRFKEQTQEALMNKRLESAKLESLVDAKKAKVEQCKRDYALINPEGVNKDTSEEDNYASELINRLNKSYSLRDDYNEQVRNKREQRLKLMQEIERKEMQMRQLRKDFNVASASLNAIKIDTARIETKCEASLSRLSSEYQMTFDYAKTKVPELDIPSAKSEVLQLRSEIDSLGNINMNAPVEYDEVNQRYEFLKEQIDDLLESRDKICTAIDEMDAVMTKQFKEMFDKINAELNNTFQALFGGGKARLILEDPSDILNTGIDVDVQPPGKAIQNIRLFSGGEKSLIAISVLFSILRVRPVPLCIFDEVEAALDQSNVERFARYLKNFSQDTQFIVVTHRPGTMIQCDVLYGVTMQKQGVSQMLKVELTDAILLSKESEEEKS